MAEDGLILGNAVAAVAAMSLENESSVEDAEVGFDEDAVDESDEEEMMVTLGFVQPVEERWTVARQHFPSKVGGTPAWLDPGNIPEGESSTCGICGNPLGFLMQVYAPLDEQDPGHKEEIFHRSLFVFVCSNMTCLQQDQHHQCKKSPEKLCRSLKVFRSQLPRANRHYSYEPPSADSLPASEGVPLCTWCGTWKGTIVCGGCKKVRYCCSTHQLAHWRGGHDAFCRTVQAELASSQNSNVANSNSQQAEPISLETTVPTKDSTRDAVQTVVQGVLSRVVATPENSGYMSAVSDKLWPEMELTIGGGEEADEYDDDDDSDFSTNSQGAGSDAEYLLEGYEKRREDGGEEFSAADMLDVQESSRDQQHWVAFQAKLAKAPDQVLRICKRLGAKPLWPALEGQPRESDIPPCLNCGGPRMFEFQLLPQLLYFLGVQNETDHDSLDWATIAVYTCAASCNIRNTSCEGYLEEFPWVQLAVT